MKIKINAQTYGRRNSRVAALTTNSFNATNIQSFRSERYCTISLYDITPSRGLTRSVYLSWIKMIFFLYWISDLLRRVCTVWNYTRTWDWIQDTSDKCTWTAVHILAYTFRTTISASQTPHLQQRLQTLSFRRLN